MDPSLTSLPSTQDEQDLFKESAAHAYASFRDKAASSRNLSIEAMQEVAQVGGWLACLRRGRLVPAKVRHLVASAA